MRAEEHGNVSAEGAEWQSKNRSWWTRNTMSYDWTDKSGLERFSKAWFEDIDRRFLHGARLFSESGNPFPELMGLADVNQRKVLEIGCGMGFHTELLLRAGADLTSIDISPTSVEATTRRLAVKDLAGDVREMDAEHLDFPDNSFDRIWSWGVIHHSARTGRILKEISRVLKPGGDVRLMVYNLEGMQAYVTMMRHYALGFWRGASLDEQLWRDTDGYSARYYTRDSWRDLLAIFFDDIDIHFYGQDSDALPLPRQLRRPLLNLLSVRKQRDLVHRRGHFLFSTARKPD